MNSRNKLFAGLAALAITSLAVTGCNKDGNGPIAPGQPVGPRYAASVIGFSSQYGNPNWSAAQALGIPDTYPDYGDISTAWASLSSDGQREYLELRFANPSPISHVSIYETYNPGAVDSIYAINPGSGLWERLWSGTAQAVTGDTARIFRVSFPLTSYPVADLRITINSPAVPGWNEIDAVAVSAGSIP